MPIYEYVCQSCSKRTEVIQRVGEKPIRICPYCGGKLKKAFSAPAIQFKGSGWYVTDYARAKSEEKKGEEQKEEKKEKKEEKAAGSEKSESGEKKAEPKKETKAKKATEGE